MHEKRRFAMGCHRVSACCFGIVSYGQFYRDRMGLGVIFALLTVSQAMLALTNYTQLKNGK